MDVDKNKLKDNKQKGSKIPGGAKRKNSRKDSTESEVGIESESWSETIVFPCKRWLAKDEDDGAIERTLEADKRLIQSVRN